MDLDRWFLVVGILLILMLIVERRIKVLPITTSMLYLAIGWAFGRLSWIEIDPLSSAAILERLAEVAVIVSLFCAGLKLRPPLDSRPWRLPVMLAALSMLISVALLSGNLIAAWLTHGLTETVWRGYLLSATWRERREDVPARGTGALGQG